VEDLEPPPLELREPELELDERPLLELRPEEDREPLELLLGE
jgi:hypothetical protein